MAQDRDDPDHPSGSEPLAALEELLADIERQPIPQRIRDLSVQLQELLDDVIARKQAD